MTEWPRVEVDPVSRLRALSAALPHTLLRERIIPARFEDVWAIAGDMEHGVPLMEVGIDSVEILEEDGEHMRVRTHSRVGVQADMDAILRPGWCVMQGSGLDIGMAARPAEDGQGTLFAHFEGVRRFGRLLHPLLWAKIGGDLRRLARLAGDRSR